MGHDRLRDRGSRRVYHDEPERTRVNGDAIEVVIASRERDLGGVAVRRVLPSTMRRLVGPFVFFDHMGPVAFAPGTGMDVRPHPHIALATITYLFEGELMHRDSLGSAQPIRPGEVNWMVAGKGIVHSERTPPEVRAEGGRLHGVQTWVALPQEDEDVEPRFEHWATSDVPHVQEPGVDLHVIAGNAYGARAKTGVLSPTLYAHARLDDGATLAIDEEHEERAIYVVDGALEIAGRPFTAGTMLVLRPRAHVEVRALFSTNAMIVGGAPLEGPRHVFWNFVSSDEERIEHAKADWQADRFPKVPGDEHERIPLPA